MGDPAQKEVQADFGSQRWMAARIQRAASMKWFAIDRPTVTDDSRWPPTPITLSID